jgi:predicted amidohydrolase
MRCAHPPRSLAIVCLLLARPAGAEEFPDGWTPTAPREEIAPAFSVERPAAAPSESGRTPPDDGAYRLVLEGKGSEAVDGRWVRTLPIVAGKHYSFRARFRAEGVETPERSVLARLVWARPKGEQVGVPEYPATAEKPGADGWTEVSDTYEAPAGAGLARIELHLRWAARGRVLWSDAGLEECAPPAARPVRLAAIHHRPRGGTPVENVERFGALVAEAAKGKPDFVCLPEGITVVGTGKTYVDVAEPVPGPTTRSLGKVAARHGTYIVAGIYEREGEAVYNTCVLLGRDGTLVGKYRKVCIPREEIDGGITPGRDYPVFETDKGRVGMMVCWDVHFPEVARELARRGAEVIFLPIWGGNETLARARAIENQVILVASGYDFTTAIFDKRGEEAARAARDPEILAVQIDLAERVLWPSLGDWRARIWREGPAPGGASTGEPTERPGKEPTGAGTGGGTGARTP